MNKLSHRYPKPYRVLFPLASVFAAVYVPLWLSWPHVFGTPVPSSLWHGHEMLFGFGLLVVAGFLTTRPGVFGMNTGLLCVTWLLARAAGFADDPFLAAAAGLSFPIAVIAGAAGPLFRGAKRLENRIAPGLLVLFAITDALWWLGNMSFGPALQQRALLSAIDGFALLLLVVGGRALPAALGGYLERRGIPRRDRIRHGYELPIAVLMGAMVVADLSGYSRVAGFCGVSAALLTLWRVRTWQLAYSLKRVDLWALALGYLWLLPGLALKGVAQLGVWVPVATAVHGITTGALGTLTLVMMARTAAARAHRRFSSDVDIGVAALLVSLATLCRLLAAHWPVLMWVAALAWSAAFLMLLLKLFGADPAAPHHTTS